MTILACLRSRHYRSSVLAYSSSGCYWQDSSTQSAKTSIANKIVKTRARLVDGRGPQRFAARAPTYVIHQRSNITTIPTTDQQTTFLIPLVVALLLVGIAYISLSLRQCRGETARQIWRIVRSSCCRCDRRAARCSSNCASGHRSTTTRCGRHPLLFRIDFFQLVDPLALYRGE